MSVKKMDEVPEKKTESKILAKMGKKEQGRCQKESVVLKNGQSTDNGKHVTVRVQRIRKIHIKQKLIIFSVLAVCLVQGDQRSKSQYFFHFYTGGCDFHFWYDCGIMLWLLWRNSGFCYDENF